MSAAQLNGRFVVPPGIDRDEIRARWERLPIPQRERLVAAVGARAAVLDFRLCPVEVALAWRPNRPIEERLVAIREILRRRPADPTPD